MRFTCDSCGAQYMISDEKVGPNGVKVRCKKCSHVILVRHAPAAPPPAEAAPAAASPGAAAWPRAEGAGDASGAPVSGAAGSAWPPPEGGAAAAASGDAAGLPGGSAGWDAPGPGAQGEGAAPPPARDELDDELGQAFDKVMGGSAEAPAGMSAGAAAAAAGLDAPQEPHAGAQAGAEPAAPARTPLAPEWYVAIDEQQVGPMPPEEVRARWEAGVVGPDSLVWCAGMADWGPLSSVPELAAFLAPFPRAERGTRTAARVEAPHAAAQPAAGPAPGGAGATAAAGGVAGAPGAEWRPGAASALAALASEELSSMDRPASALAEGAARGRLVESMNLPDTGGVDPTGAIPLPIKGLEPTGERKVSSVARTTQEVRLKRSANRSIVVAAAVVLVAFAVGAGALYWYFDRRLEAHGLTVKPRSVPPTAQAPAPQAEGAPGATPFGTQPAPAAAGGPVGAAPPAGAPDAIRPATGSAQAGVAPGAAPGAAPQGAAPPAGPSPGAPAPGAQAAAQAMAPAPSPAAAPATAAAAPAVAAAPSEPPPEPAQKAAPKKKGKAEPKLTPPRKASSARALASASSAPGASAPAGKKTGDPLLDATDVDAAFERELQAGAPPKRSVYVPPATGSDLPDKLTESQIQEGVASRIDALKQCVSEQQAKSPDVHGTLKLQWTIQGDGSVGGVKVQSPELAGQPISGCIANVVKGIRFPRSRTTGQAVSFPFGF